MTNYFLLLNVKISKTFYLKEKKIKIVVVHHQHGCVMCNVYFCYKILLPSPISIPNIRNIEIVPDYFIS